MYRYNAKRLKLFDTLYIYGGGGGGVFSSLGKPLNKWRSLAYAAFVKVVCLYLSFNHNRCEGLVRFYESMFA